MRREGAQVRNMQAGDLSVSSALNSPRSSYTECEPTVAGKASGRHIIGGGGERASAMSL